MIFGIFLACLWIRKRGNANIMGTVLKGGLAEFTVVTAH